MVSGSGRWASLLDISAECLGHSAAKPLSTLKPVGIGRFLFSVRRVSIPLVSKTIMVYSGQASLMMLVLYCFVSCPYFGLEAFVAVFRIRPVNNTVENLKYAF